LGSKGQKHATVGDDGRQVQTWVQVESILGKGAAMILSCNHAAGRAKIWRQEHGGQAIPIYPGDKESERKAGSFWG
jgi:hypothetical protein